MGLSNYLVFPKNKKELDDFKIVYVLYNIKNLSDDMGLVFCLILHYLKNLKNPNKLILSYYKPSPSSDLSSYSPTAFDPSILIKKKKL